MEVSRVVYAKKGTPIIDREYQIERGGPVGNIKEYHEHVLPRLQVVSSITFLDHKEAEVITLYRKGYLTIQAPGKPIIETTVDKLYNPEEAAKLGIK